MNEERRENRRLTPSEQDAAKQILGAARCRLEGAAQGDPELLFALRRYVYVRLTHDERGKPMQRRVLKLQKMADQRGLCALCRQPLPRRNAVLDRFNATDGYSASNTRVLCPTCDAAVQAERKFS
jgi:hypothetical protein